MSDGEAAGSTVTWRTLWAEAARVAGGRPQGRWLCEVASGLDGDELTAALDTPASQRGVAHLDAMLARLATGEPLQYVLGRWAFRRLDLMVDRRVLIPRSETEGLVEVALALVADQPPRRCADLGCGSGAIGLSLAVELPPGTEVWLTDASADALDVARANSAGIGRAAAGVRFGLGSWFDALPEELRGRFDLICSNPPYVAVGAPDLEPVVRDWEPHLALFGGDDGADAIRVLASGAGRWLRPGGWLVVEIGSAQAAAATELAHTAGLQQVAVHRDAAGLHRVLTARAAT